MTERAIVWSCILPVKDGSHARFLLLQCRDGSSMGAATTEQRASLCRRTTATDLMSAVMVDAAGLGGWRSNEVSVNALRPRGLDDGAFVDAMEVSLRQAATSSSLSSSSPQPRRGQTVDVVVAPEVAVPGSACVVEVRLVTAEAERHGVAPSSFVLLRLSMDPCGSLAALGVIRMAQAAVRELDGMRALAAKHVQEASELRRRVSELTKARLEEDGVTLRSFCAVVNSKKQRIAELMEAAGNGAATTDEVATQPSSLKAPVQKKRARSPPPSDTDDDTCDSEEDGKADSATPARASPPRATPKKT